MSTGCVKTEGQGSVAPFNAPFARKKGKHAPENEPEVRFRSALMIGDGHPEKKSGKNRVRKKIPS